jgi:hypothetical protein
LFDANTGASVVPNRGGCGITTSEFVAGALVCVVGESGNSRTRLEAGTATTLDGVVWTKAGEAPRELNTCAGSTGWPKNFATQKPATTNAEAKKIF